MSPPVITEGSGPGRAITLVIVVSSTDHPATDQLWCSQHAINSGISGKDAERCVISGIFNGRSCKKHTPQSCAPNVPGTSGLRSPTVWSAGANTSRASSLKPPPRISLTHLPAPDTVGPTVPRRSLYPYPDVGGAFPPADATGPPPQLASQPRGVVRAAEVWLAEPAPLPACASRS